ncbi:MAG: ferrous iron transport protein B [Bacteroidetes bacterium]|nr:ferrous iron transport protein B [Bacteroidota bacterium]
MALVGNPNSGKTTLFNALTGLNQKVGNFPGVTVDRKTGKFFIADGKEINIVDLPGTYSLYPKSMDETVTKKILCDTSDKDHPDAVVLVVDASNLKRNLLLCTQVIDLGIPCILVLNMMDLAHKQNLTIDKDIIAKKLSVKVVEMNAREKEGLAHLKKVLAEPFEKPNSSVFNQDYFAPGVIEDIKALSNPEDSFYSQLHIACDPSYCKGKTKKMQDSLNTVSDLFNKHNIDENRLQSDEMVFRYQFISSLLKESITKIPAEPKDDFTAKVDKILTHKIYGFLFFMAVLFVIFQTIYNLSAYPMEFIEWGFVQLSISVSNLLPEGILNSLIVDGIIAGLSGILIFIPQIAFLFAFIAILEDTGYMSRVSFIMDKLMRKIGLNGKSVIPLLSGTACAVPAIMSTRTIGNWKERLITLMVIPLISCAARIPVYTLLIALVIPNEFLFGLFNWQGIALMILYLLGFVAAIGAAYVLKLILKTQERSHFIMEMPVYRAPRWSSVGLTIVEKVKAFVFEAGKVILAISIVLWFLSSFGPGDTFEQIETKWANTEIAQEEAEEQIATEKLEASYAGRFGKSIEPAIRPLGFDWKIGIALLTSFAAREVFVGTMATIYSVGDPDNTSSIREKMKAEINPETGEKRYTKATGISLMIFFAFALQCMSTLAITYRETRHWKWPFAQFLFMGILAYVSSYIAYNIFL